MIAMFNFQRSMVVFVFFLAAGLKPASSEDLKVQCIHDEKAVCDAVQKSFKETGGSINVETSHRLHDIDNDEAAIVSSGQIRKYKRGIDKIKVQEWMIYVPDVSMRRMVDKYNIPPRPDEYPNFCRACGCCQESEFEGLYMLVPDNVSPKLQGVLSRSYDDTFRQTFYRNLK